MAPLMADPIPQPHGGALTPWKPGQSGNPAGRPTDSQRMLRALLDRRPNVVSSAAAAWDAVLCDSEHKHWPAAFKEFLARVDGPAGDGDTITHARAGEMVRTIMAVIRSELPEGDAERVVRAILDALSGTRTVEAEAQITSEE